MEGPDQGRSGHGPAGSQPAMGHHHGEVGDIQTIRTSTGPGPAMTWIRASEAAENIIPCPPATLPSPLLDCLFI